MQSKQCPKCSGSMAEGFVLDATHGGTAVSSWVEGAAEMSMWTGVKLTGRARAEIAAWRCNRCGFLEHYATATPDRSHEARQRKQALLVIAGFVGGSARRAGGGVAAEVASHGTAVNQWDSY